MFAEREALPFRERRGQFPMAMGIAARLSPWNKRLLHGATLLIYADEINEKMGGVRRRKKVDKSSRGNKIFIC
jgi:hypothetical protein